jgi:hypothetical protein
MPTSRGSPNRPAHAEVDDDAWAVVKAHAVRRRVAVGRVVGLLVREACRGLTIGLTIAPQLDGQPLSGRRANRFVRLLDVDDDHWLTFRARAVNADVTTARLLGLIVEAEARRLGWRPNTE